MAEKCVIIGSGPAAWTAAIYAARAQLNPVVYEGGVSEDPRFTGMIPLGQLAFTTEVENFPSWPAGDLRQYLATALPKDRQPYWVQDNEPQPTHVIWGPPLVDLMKQQAENFGTRVVTEFISQVDFSRRPFILTTEAGKKFETKTVIIATGARANYLGLPSEDKYKNHGVSACAVCDGALPLFRDKPLVVVGGGDSAVEEATYLTKFASVVYMVHRRHELRASKIMAQRATTHPKIQMKWNREVEEVLGDGQFVTGVRLKSTVDDARETLQAGGMFVAIGHTPNTEFLKGQVDLEPNGYLKLTAPQRTYTSVPGVFAAGDVADSYYRQAVSAAGTGCMAALDAERFLSEHGDH
jgi:thioredoxin reductase (NADPH)